MPGGIGTSEPLTARQRSPASRTWPTPVQTPDEIERDHLLPDEASVDTAGTLAFVVVGEGSAHAAAEQGGSRLPATTTAVTTCTAMASGTIDSHGRGGEAAQGGEQGVERQVVELDGDQHHAHGDPRDGQSDLSSAWKSTVPNPQWRRGANVSLRGRCRSPNRPRPYPTRRPISATAGRGWPPALPAVQHGEGADADQASAE